MSGRHHTVFWFSLLPGRAAQQSHRSRAVTTPFLADQRLLSAVLTPGAAAQVSGPLIRVCPWTSPRRGPSGDSLPTHLRLCPQGRCKPLSLAWGPVLSRQPETGLGAPVPRTVSCLPVWRERPLEPSARISGSSVVLPSARPRAPCHLPFCTLDLSGLLTPYTDRHHFFEDGHSLSSLLTALRAPDPQWFCLGDDSPVPTAAADLWRHPQHQRDRPRAGLGSKPCGHCDC